MLRHDTLTTERNQFRSIGSPSGAAMRRYIVEYLHGASGRVTIDEVVDDLVTNALSLDECRTTIALHHVHLPWLSDAGVIEYDRGDNSITLVQ